MNRLKQTSCIVLLSIFGIFSVHSSAFAFWKTLFGGKQDMKLVSVKTSGPIALDAVAEQAWQKAEALEITVDELPYEPNNGYKGMKKTTVTLKSMYDEKYVYFYVQYDDPTQSLERFPWVKQSDGSWKQLKKKDSTGHENTYYEDKFSFFWNINSEGFQKKGCDKSCHMVEDGMLDGVKDSSAGRHYTSEQGETIDMWHWKGVRTNPVGQTDDQYVNSDRKAQHKNWGRHGDHKLGGGYANNINSDKTGPAFMHRSGKHNDYWIKDSEKTAFVDTFKTGDMIPGIIIAPFQGSEGDIATQGVWKDGKWTLEIRRPLITTGAYAAIQDIQFDDLKKTYYFGIAVFDNSQINHLYHKKSLQLKFQ